MKDIEINSTGNRVNISLDKNVFGLKLVNNILDRFTVESLIQKAEAKPAIEKLGKQFKKDWWERNKGKYLK